MSIISDSKSCPKCGRPISPETPQGLCPKCLLSQASIPTDAGKDASTKAVPPTHEELAAAFPQLEILELIGQGGMGFVFKARQPKIERLVALKILPQSLAADPAFAERFTREGRVLARLNHPNIVAIHDFGQASGWFYLLMEFVDGVNLRQAMRAGRFTPAQALEVVPKICEALQFAHNEGILHRDIKPENILLDAKGRVKIADFGIAKLVGESQNDDALTASGATLGTPRYMAPEQLEGSAEVDHRADIYSLGVVFYEMLTGELPLGKFQPPSQKARMDARLDEVVLHALEKEPERRYQQASQVKTAVDTIASGPPPASAPQMPGPALQPAPDRFWKRLALAAALLLLAMILVPVVAILLAMIIPAFQKAHARATAVRQQIEASSTAQRMPDPVFGAMIERTINRASTGTNFLFNFKTGELRTPPPESDREGLNIHRWASRAGLDAAVGVLNGNNDVLTGFDMAALPAPAQCWEELTPAAAAARLEDQPDSAFVVMLNANGSLLETCAFRTRDGGIGILQLVAYVSQPPGIKIRYKFADRVPASSQTQTNALAAKSWTPALFPGEKPDLGKILEEARQLTATTHFEEALQRYLWHYHHAQEWGDSYRNIVRLTSALSDWVELGRRYPKAKQALIEIRDNTTREIAAGRGYLEMFKEVQAVNHELQDDDATCALFKTIHKQDPKLARQCYYYAESLLVEHGDYQICLDCMGDPQQRYNSILQSLEMQPESSSFNRAVPGRPLRATPNDGITSAPVRLVSGRPLRATNEATVAASAMMKRFSETNFVSQVCQLIEILVGTAHQADAEKIRDQAMTVLDDARLKSAISDAEQRVQKVHEADTTIALRKAKAMLAEARAKGFSDSHPTVVALMERIKALESK